jgi:tRNA threonylcarbamoyladenosine biosynthesis protein TsaE
MSEVRVWKKVHESDLENIVSEMKDVLTSPCAIILSGPVGAGKTTFTKKFITNDEGEVCSPTYSIINESGDCAHADFYRLEDAEEIVHLELALYLEDKNFFLIEWGKEFLKEIQRNIDVDWRIYELEIQINESDSSDLSTSSRNLILSDIK